jgi:predicted Zn-dependent protease
MTQIQDLVEAALSASTADGCVVLAEEHTETNLRWAANSLTTNGQMRTRSVTVISTVDGSAGTSAGVLTRAITTEDELLELVRAADTAARTSAPADDSAPLVEKYDNDDDWGSDPAETSVSVFEQFAPALGAAFDKWTKADRVLFGFAEHHMTSTYLGTSTGLRRRFDQPDGRVEINGKSADLSQSAYVDQHTNDFNDVDAAALTDGLLQRLDWASRRIDLPAGRYETIMPGGPVAAMTIYAYISAAARDAAEGRSVYSGADGATRLGETLSPHPLRLYSDPDYPGLECAPFPIVPASAWGIYSVFDNGYPTGTTDWVRDGKLTNLISNRGWALRNGAEARPPVENLILDGNGTASLDDMIADTERALLLTTLWYIREVDPQTLLLTGLTRDGVYLVENGKVQGAVNNFRFNESPIDLWGRATEVGRTVPAMSREWNDFFRRTAMPALRIPDFNMSTVSQAS